MAGYICKNCNFKVDGRRVERCPWCDSKGSMREEQSADDILKELE